MRIAGMLIPEVIVTELAVSGREEAIARLVRLLAVRGIETASALKAVMARERSGPTLVALGRYGLAIPHAHSPAAKQLVLAVGLSREGIPWDGPEARRAHLVMVLLGPPQTQALYLRLLSRIVRIGESAGFMESLLQARSAEDVIAQLAAAEEPLGEIVCVEGMPTFCVLGAGPGGLAMAAHLALSGCKVNLFNRSAARLEPIQARGGIDVDGEISGFAALHRATADPAEAIDDCDVLMAVVPAMAHRHLAETLAPHLKDGQVLVLNPGRTGGALEAALVIREKNPRVRVYIAEAQTLLYAARATNPGQVHIHRIKNSVPLATLPAYHIVDVLPTIQKALPQFVPGDNVLKTSLDNIGAVFHPTIAILNAGRIEDTHGDFEYYVEGVTPAVARVLEAVDRERVNVAAALGIRATTAREWLYLAYDAAGRTLYEAMKANAGYRGIRAPGTIEHRYISEDVPASLVPIASIGEMLGVPAPTIGAVIRLACVMHGVDYWAEGRTVNRLGIQGMSVKEIRFLVVGAELGPAAPAAGGPGPAPPGGEAGPDRSLPPRWTGEAGGD